MTQQDPYVAPAEPPREGSRTPPATDDEKRAASYSIYLYFLVFEQLVACAVVARTGPKRSVVAYGIVLGATLLTARAFYTAGRGLRALLPNYLLSLRACLWYAGGWAVLYLSRATHGALSSDLYAALYRALVLAYIYSWLYKKTADGTLRGRALASDKLPTTLLPLLLIGAHLGSYVVGSIVSH